MPMHDSPRDQLLHAMARQDWANESNGNVEAPTGWFCRISNSPEELPEVFGAFPEQITEFAKFDLRELVGHFLLVENDQGQIFVTEYDSEDEVKAEFDYLSDVYTMWSDD